jgi:tetratricopeptide (TPR) repeat protein
MRNEGKAIRKTFRNPVLSPRQLLPLLLVLSLGFLPQPAIGQQFDNTNVLVEKAVTDIYGGRYQQAYEVLKKAYEQSPRHPRVHFNLGRLFELTGNHTEALKEYQITALLDPSMVAARRGIARCTVEIKTRRTPEILPTQTSAAARSLPAAPGRADPGRANAPIITQVFQPMVNRPAQPLPSSSQATYQGTSGLVNPPNMPAGTSRPAAALPALPILPGSSAPNPGSPAATRPTMHLPQLSPAPTVTALPQIPNAAVQEARASGRTQLLVQAEALLAKGKASQALQMLEPEAAETENPDLLFLLGKAYTQKGELFSAIKAFEETLKIDEKNYDAYYLLAQCYARVNLLDEAIRNYQSYFAVKPQAGVAVEMARIYERMGKNEEAVAFYAKANAMNPGNAQLQDRLGEAKNKKTEELYMRANHALTTGDAYGALSLFEQALTVGGLSAAQERDSRRKLEIARLRIEENERKAQPARDGFQTTRKMYGTTNLKFSQLADIDFQTRFTEPVMVEWRAYVARSFRQYGRDFLLMIKELSRDELDDFGKDRNDFRLNRHYNNQPLFLITAKQGELPTFVKEGALITFTGKTDWKRYDVINELGQTVKLPAFDFLAAYP